MKHYYLLLLFVLSSIFAHGQKIVTIDNIKYYLENGEAAIISQDESLSGNIVIPETVSHNGTDYSITSIDGNAFSSTKISLITLPNSITALGKSCFRNCSNLVSIKLPNNIKTLENMCFHNCSSLTSITLPNGITTLGSSCFSGCTNLTSITLPNSITTLGSSCFAGCSNLTSITLPNGITTLGDGCFYNCTSLTTITLPNSITELGDRCFENCSNLIKVDCNWTTFDGVNIYKYYNNQYHSYTYKTFTGIYSEARLHVPQGTREMYAAAEPWKNSFKTIIEKDAGEEEKPEAKICATPTINYNNKELTFDSETEGAEYHYTITDSDIKAADTYSQDGKVSLTATYYISVWASAEGYTNSKKATATLYFIDAALQDETDITEINANRGIMVTSENGILTVSGLDEGEVVEAYSLQGMKLTQAKANSNSVRMQINETQKMVILKIGNESLKVQM